MNRVEFVSQVFQKLEEKHYIVYDSQRNVFLDPMPNGWPLEDYVISKCIEIIG